MKKELFFVFILLCRLFPAFSQNCPNADFSLLNFDYWRPYIGNNNGFSYGCCPIPGTFPGRHTLITEPMVDPTTCGGLTVPPPGYELCARLGDPHTQCEAEQLVYELTVDPANPIFFYTFAVVLTDPHFTILHQPHFSVRVQTIDYHWIDTLCGLYEVYSDSAAPGFQTCTSDPYHPVNWRDWSTIAINLTGLEGVRLRIIFTTYDCECSNEQSELSGPYFGIAYITAACGKLEINQAICAGNNYLNLTAPPGYSYLWNTGDTTQMISLQNPLFGTTYHCQLTGVTGCVYNLSTTIGLNVFTVLYPGFTYTREPCSRIVTFNNTTTINTGSTFSSHWDFGDGTSSNLKNPKKHTYPAPGQYNVSLTITSPGGCDSTITHVVDISNLPLAVFSAGDTCLPSAIPFHNYSVIPDSINAWTWSFGDGSPIDTLDWEPSHIYAGPGEYPVILWVTDTNGCTDSISHKIMVYEPVYANFSHSALNCSDSTTEITFTGRALATTSFTWDFNGGMILSGSGPGPYVIQWPDSGNYFVSLTLDGPTCDTACYSDTIHVIKSPIAQASCDTSICSGQQVTLGASGGQTYVWSPGEYLNQTNIPDPVAAPPSTTTFYVDVYTDQCHSRDSVTVTILPLPLVSVSADTAICLGDSTTLFASGGIQFLWSPSSGLNAPDIPNPLVSPPGPTIYTVTVTDTNGCSARDSVFINILALPVAFAGTDTAICRGDSIMLNATGGIIYLWSPTGGLNNVNIPNPVASPLVTTAYTVSVSDSNSCTNTDEVILTVINIPVASFTPGQNPCCLEDSLLIFYTGDASPAANYNWNFGGVTPVSGSGQGPYAVIWPVAGNYIITLQVEENKCISSEDTVIVTVEKVEASIISIQDAICFGSADGSATSTGYGGIPPYLFTWSDSTTNSVLDSVPAGNYFVTVTDSAGCSGTDTITISSPLPFTISSTVSNSSCEYLCNGEVNITVEGGTAPYTYLWNTEPNQHTSSISDLCPGTFQLTVSDTNNCDSVITFQLSFNTSIQASCFTDVVSGPVPLTVNFTYTGSGANSVSWIFGDSTTSTVFNPSHTYTSVGDYQVTFVVNSMDPDFCTDTTILYIHVEDTSYLQVPTVFTPNNDGFNDYFEVRSNYLQNYSMLIFNRWGTVIFESTDINAKWDGKTEDGIDVPEGTYFFSVGAKGKDGIPYSKKGAVTLLR